MFLISSDGFSLSWTASHQEKPCELQRDEGRGGGGEDEFVVGRIQIGSLSTITRVPLDADDLRDIAFSRARAVSTTASTSTSQTQRYPPPPESLSGSAGERLSNSAREKFACSNKRESNSFYGIAAFCLDSSCEVGRVSLVYGVTPASDQPTKHGGIDEGTVKERALASPEVWLQDMSCR